MSVMLETSLGELVIDLEVDKCPKTCANFLKLCKVKYYALNAFFNVIRRLENSSSYPVSKDFIAQTGDPTASGTGGESLASFLHSISQQPGSAPRYFAPEINNKLKHVSRGTVSMAVSPTDPPGCGSQFFITLADKIEYLDGKHAVFGHVIEGFDTLDKINDAFCDKDGRPLQDIRIRHVEILVRIAEDENPFEEIPEDERDAKRRETAAASSALTLEMIGDIPFAAVRPPENILFVCKLNPVTQDEDLELIFSRFGKILSCEIVRDRKSGDSLQYAFIEFDEQESAEQAYFKMQNVLVDDRRIWVDFSQSVAKMNVSQVTSRGRGGRGGGRGGFGGRDGGGFGGRGGGPPRDRDSGYGSRGGRDRGEPDYSIGGGGGRGDGYSMVFDEGRGKRVRSRSPKRRERSREKDSRDRGYSDRRRDDRERDRYRDDRRDDRRDRDRDDRRDRDRDYRRERDDRDRRR